MFFSKRAHQIHFLEFIYTPIDGLSATITKRNAKFKILTIIANGPTLKGLVVEPN